MTPKEFLAKAEKKLARIEAAMDAVMDRTLDDAVAAFALIPDAALELYTVGAELHAAGRQAKRHGRRAEAEFHRSLAMTVQRWADDARAKAVRP